MVPREGARACTCCFSTLRVTRSAPSRACSRKVRWPTGPTVPTVILSTDGKSNDGFTMASPNWPHQMPPHDWCRQFAWIRPSRGLELLEVAGGVHGQHDRSEVSV